MMARMQITMDPELQRRARKKANDMGVSLAEYVRTLVSRDVGSARPSVGIEAIFDLGDSGGSNIAKNKDAMIAEAFAAGRRLPRR